MSVDEMLGREQLRGLPYETAKLYGMPHIGAKYYREDLSATKWTGDYRVCAACGKAGGAHSRHHEPPRSKGTFRLDTPMGSFVLLPALIDLCGSGTTGCHGDRHNGRLKIRWEWDAPEYEEMWWNGHFLSRPYHPPHGEWLYRYGRYVLTDAEGREWEHRG